MRKKSDLARGVQVGRAIAAYPAVLVALVVALALAVTAYGPSQVTAVADSATPTETQAAAAA